MPKGINQKLKLLYIVKILERETDEAHPMSTSRIIEELEKNDISAERKSIYDDIAVLQDFGYDIILNPSKKNGGYYLGSREFELPELKILVDAVQSSRFITPAKSRELIGKLEKLCNKFDESELKRQVYVLNRIKADNESIYYVVNDIYQAIQHNKQISFEYLAWNEKKQKVAKQDKKYRVSPWTLAFNDGNYYLVAYDELTGGIKHYRVDKIKTVTELEDGREGNDAFEHFDVASYLNKTFNMYGGTDESVTVSINHNLVGVFIDRFGDGIGINIKSEDKLEVRIQVAVSSQFYGWLAGLGPGVSIVSPVEIRKNYCEYLKSIIDDNM